MFHYGSGCISDISLRDNARVYIYFLFPMNYIKYLKHGLRGGYFPRDSEYPLEAASHYRNSIFGEYIPLMIPLTGEYVRDGWVNLDDPSDEQDSKEQAFLISYLEEYFNVDIAKRLSDLSDYIPSVPDQDTVIDETNIFNYVGVAFEHKSFIDEVFEGVKAEGQLAEDCKDVYGLMATNKDSLLQHQIICDNYDKTYIEKIEFEREGLELDNYELRGYRYQKSKNIMRAIVRHIAVVRFMIYNNKNFKLPGMGQQSHQYYFMDLYRKARDVTIDVDRENDAKHAEG